MGALSHWALHRTRYRDIIYILLFFLDYVGLHSLPIVIFKIISSNLHLILPLSFKAILFSNMHNIDICFMLQNYKSDQLNPPKCVNQIKETARLYPRRKSWFEKMAQMYRN
jgi:hypothetical protein